MPMLPSFLVPLALVLGVALLAPRSWLSGPAMRWRIVLALFIATVAVIVRYLGWRIEETMPRPGTGTAELVFYWAIFVIEMLIWLDTLILFAMLSRQRDNSGAADAGEERLRATPAGDLPTVDVFIATYNEDIEVLEKTIIGATSLDWPVERLRVCVLDDGKRDWLRVYCERKGVEYFTRDGNAHAKAGNINAAIARTEGEFFMILDADFIPQETFLFRAMGLFEDPKVGIVQVPHSFYNADPMQANLGMRDVLPDDQRLFFGKIMAGRDGWDTAFCCGSNSITRRTAMEAIGGKLPTGSLTEDMLLTLALLRKGFVTRYLNERLAIGLAPESLSAMYVQRARWARGAIQILFLKEGPFGPGLGLCERLMFLPLHWIVQPLMVATTLLTPAICLWTGWSPLPGVTPAEILSFQIPALVATLAALRLVAPNAFFPISATVHSCLQAPRILPAVVTTLLRPHGHGFRVTPKGRAAGGRALDRWMIMLPAAIILATSLGIYFNSDINSRILESTREVPLLVFWAIASTVVLTILQAVAISPPGEPGEESFPVDLACTVSPRPGVVEEVRLEGLSLSEARLKISGPSEIPENTGWLRLTIPGFGPVAGYLSAMEGTAMSVSLHLPEDARREDLIRMLFTTGLDNSLGKTSELRIMVALAARAVGWRKESPVRRRAPATPPPWLRDLPSR